MPLRRLRTMMPAALSLSCMECCSVGMTCPNKSPYSTHHARAPRRAIERKKGHRSGLGLDMPSHLGMARLVARLVHQLVLGDPGHHGTQLATDLLDGVLGVLAAAGRHRRVVQAALADEHLGVFTALDALQGVAHGFARLFIDDFRAGHVLT